VVPFLLSGAPPPKKNSGFARETKFYLTIRPVALAGYGSIAHSARGP